MKLVPSVVGGDTRFAEVRGLPENMVKAYMFFSGETFKQLQLAIGRLATIAVQSAQVRVMLGIKPIEAAERAQDDSEKRLAGFLEKRFPGRADVKAVLLNPQSRARVMTLFGKMVADKQLHRDLEARYTMQEAEAKAAQTAYDTALAEAEAKRTGGGEDPKSGGGSREAT